MPSSEEDGKLAKLTSRILEQRLRAATTVVLLCVASAEQVGLDSTARFFKPVVSSEKQRIWLVNKVDSEDDYLEVQTKLGEETEADGTVKRTAGRLKELVAEDCILYVSARQLLAYRCAEALERRAGSSGEAVPLPALGSALELACQTEVEAIVGAMVPAASRYSRHWREQYEQARRSSWLQLCHATQIPASTHSERNADGSRGFDGEDVDHSCNASLRSTFLRELHAARLRLTLRHVAPLVVKCVREVSGAHADLLALQRSAGRRGLAWAALQQCLPSDVEAGMSKAKLSQAVISLAESRIQQILQELRTATSDHLTKLNSALEDLEVELLQLQRSWITKGDEAVQHLCDEFELLEPVRIIDELQGRAGIVPGVESVLFRFFSGFQQESKQAQELRSWVESTCQFYLEGIRAAAWPAAKRFVDATRAQIAAAIDRKEDDMLRCQWELAAGQWRAARLEQRQALLTSIIYMRGADLLEYELLSSGQQQFLLDRSIPAESGVDKQSDTEKEGALEEGKAVADLSARHPEWVWWANQDLTYSTSRFKSLWTNSTASATSEQELLNLARQIAFVHAQEFDNSESAALKFVRDLPSACTGDSAGLAVSLWLSKANLYGKELSDLVNDAIWADALPALRPAVQLLLALFFGSPERALGHASGELDCWYVFRGSTMLDSNRDFFSTGRQFRMPPAFSAYFERDDAMASAKSQTNSSARRQPVLWTVRVDRPSQQTTVRLLEGTDGRKKGLLFCPYFCFCVQRAEWREQANLESPHCVELLACPGSAEHSVSEKWPLAPQC
eukprot:TRINITY_DN25213_c0_g2_i1.p1 TRINITY_DN25213_c0_g2~~TRINITY_DN25213_c0_g2_i1.p1  ORF type:complete len:794 (-),score=188.45 TRINITY_DN25213_c0_g2_i1:44-2425(-)